MNKIDFKDKMEKNQAMIYILTLIIASLIGNIYPNFSNNLYNYISIVLGILLYSMFTQIPFFELKRSLKNKNFIKALFISNYIFVPIIVWIISRFVAYDVSLLLGVILVLLTPCIDYVIVFTALGKGDEKLILVSTPFLFITQIILLPMYLYLFIGKEAINIISVEPFLESFIYFIIIPLLFALLTQLLDKRKIININLVNKISWVPVPFMAITLFVIIASQINKLFLSFSIVLKVIPIYMVYMIITPIIAYFISKVFKLNSKEKRTLMFSSSTRNSLVVLSFTMSLPNTIGELVAVVIVTQTIVEIIIELFYIKIMPKVK